VDLAIDVDDGMRVLEVLLELNGLICGQPIEVFAFFGVLYCLVPDEYAIAHLVADFAVSIRTLDPVVGLDDFRVPKHALEYNSVLWLELEWRVQQSLSCFVLESLILFLDGASKEIIVCLLLFLVAENSLQRPKIDMVQSNWVPLFDFEHLAELSPLAWSQIYTTHVTREEGSGLSETLGCNLQ